MIVSDTMRKNPLHPHGIDPRSLSGTIGYTSTNDPRNQSSIA